MVLCSRNFIIIIFVLFIIVGLYFFGPLFLSSQKVEAGEVSSSVTIVAQYNLYQNNFSFYSATNSYSPDDIWPPGDYDLPTNEGLSIASFPIHQGDIIRLKISFIANTNIPMGSVRFKLQFKTQGAGCSADETWYDVGNEGSGMAWQGFDIPDLTDDTFITDDPMMPDSDMNGGYNEFGVSDWNQDDIPSGYDIEYDWVLYNYSATYGETYCFRVAQVDSADQTVAMPDYNRYIEIQTLPEYAGMTTNTNVDYTTGDSFYLTNPDDTQFFVDVPENYASTARDFEIFSFAKDDIMSTIDPPSNRNTIGDYVYQMQSEEDSFFYQDFDQLISISISYDESDVVGCDEDTLEIRRWDGQQWIALSSTVDTTNNLITATTTSFSFFGIFGEEAECGNDIQEGSEECDGSDLAGETCISQNYDEGILSCKTDCTFDTSNCSITPVCGNNVKEGSEQCDGSDLAGETCVSRGYSSGDLSCSANCTFNTSSCSSGGGGGGGGGWSPPPAVTKVIIKGKAYPDAEITLLADGKVEATKKADSLANFIFEITDITSGIYTFSLWALDKAGTRSITFSFTTNIAKDVSTTVSGIFLPPTIELSKIRVQKGEILNIYGQSAPESKIEISVESTEAIIKRTIADGQGLWEYYFDTSPLDEGSHIARAKAVSPGGLLSTYSHTLIFALGGEEIITQMERGDINTDNRINLVDFSILLYNWGTPKSSVSDLNSDGKVNLVDFSIMLYYWTG